MEFKKIILFLSMFFCFTQMQAGIVNWLWNAPRAFFGIFSLFKGFTPASRHEADALNGKLAMLEKQLEALQKTRGTNNQEYDQKIKELSSRVETNKSLVGHLQEFSGKHHIQTKKDLLALDEKLTKAKDDQIKMIQEQKKQFIAKMDQLENLTKQSIANIQQRIGSVKKELDTQYTGQFAVIKAHWHQQLKAMDETIEHEHAKFEKMLGQQESEIAGWESAKNSLETKITKEQQRSSALTEENTKIILGLKRRLDPLSAIIKELKVATEKHRMPYVNLAKEIKSKDLGGLKPQNTFVSLD